MRRRLLPALLLAAPLLHGCGGDADAPEARIGRESPLPAATVPPIRLVVIDAKTQGVFGPLPWPRDRIAQMVALLDRAGARTIVLRFYFRDGRGDAGDRALVDAVAKAGRVFSETGQVPQPEGWQAPADWIAGQALRLDGPPPRGLREPAHLKLPFEELSRALKGVGSVDVLVRNGKLESLPLLMRWQGHTLPSLALRVFLQSMNLEGLPLSYMTTMGTRFGIFPVRVAKGLRIGRLRIALDAYGATLVNLSPAGRGYPTHSFVDVLQAKVKPAVFKDAVVLVGAESSDQNVETATGPKGGLELTADQLRALYQFYASAVK